MGTAIAAEGVCHLGLYALTSDLLMVAFGSRSLVWWDVKRAVPSDVDWLQRKELGTYFHLLILISLMAHIPSTQLYKLISL